MLKKFTVVFIVCLLAGLLTAKIAGDYTYDKTKETEFSQNCQSGDTCTRNVFGSPGFPYAESRVYCQDDVCSADPIKFNGVPYSFINVMIYTAAYMVVSGVNMAVLVRISNAHTRH